jgi:hypothetical protein
MKAACGGYIGNKNIEEDVDHRAMLVLEVSEAIKADINSTDREIERSSDVLKIFAMPEFYWRGPDGAYTHIRSDLRRCYRGI